MIGNSNVLIKLIDRRRIEAAQGVVHAVDRALLVCNQSIGKPHRHGVNTQCGKKRLMNRVADDPQSETGNIFNTVDGANVVGDAAEADLPVAKALNAGRLNVCGQLLADLTIEDSVSLLGIGKHVGQVKNTDRRRVVGQEGGGGAGHVDIAHLDGLNKLGRAAEGAVGIDIDLPLAGSLLVENLSELSGGHGRRMLFGINGTERKNIGRRGRIRSRSGISCSVRCRAGIL